jgi:protein-disulfide isomerase
MSANPILAAFELAGGSFIFLAFVIVLILAVAYGYYSVRGSGIGQRGWSDRDQAFGTRVGKDPTTDVSTWGRGSASARPSKRRKTELEQRTAEAISGAAGGAQDPTWRARIGESVQLDPPVDPERDHVRGAETPAVTLVEYGEYECRYCREADEVLERIATDRADLQLVFRHFPQSSIHPGAFDAAIAVEAAARQGRYVELHRALARSKKTLSPELVRSLAGKAGLDLEQFDADRADAALRARVEDDLASGLRSGVNGTPTFFINNVRYDGDFEREELIAAIDAAAAVVEEQRT